MRDSAGSAAAPAVSFKNLRRKSFMWPPKKPWSADYQPAARDSRALPMQCLFLAHCVDSLRCEGSDAIGAKRTCRGRRERVDLTKMTQGGPKPGRNPAAQQSLAAHDVLPLLGQIDRPKSAAVIVIGGTCFSKLNWVQ
jgi:hypothetical protein